jgi:hypothetical protein
VLGPLTLERDAVEAGLQISFVVAQEERIEVCEGFRSQFPMVLMVDHSPDRIDNLRENRCLQELKM